MDILQNEKEDPVKKSIYPYLDPNQFQSIKENINNKKNFIGDKLLTFYDYKNMDNSTKIEEKHIDNTKKSIKKAKINLFFRPKEEPRKIRYMGRTSNIILPKQVFIKKMRKKYNNENSDFLFNIEDTKTKNIFYDSMFITGNNILTKEKNVNLNKSENKQRNKTSMKKNFNDNFLKTVRKLDYDNGKIYNHIKREKNFYDNIKSNFDEKYRAYHWKFIMTDNEKDLRPDTFFGKAGEEVFQKNFHTQLDSMINNLKNVDVVNIRNMQKKRKEHSDMEEILKKRIKEEKINRDYINNILERNQVITNLILKK